jgi:hypothetical protein
MTAESRFKRWKKPLTIVFFLVLIVLFTLLARRIDWSEVVQTLGDFKVRTLVIAGALTLCSFLVYASFDLIGRTYIRQNLVWKQILPVGIISYAFNLNLSAWVGGIAMRYRLYSRLGVSTGNIAKILGLSLATNWFGYMAIAGVVFSSGDHAAGVEGQHHGLARHWCVVGAGQPGLSGGLPVFEETRVDDSRHGNQPAISAHGVLAVAAGRVELVADGGGDFHPAAGQTGLSTGTGRVTDQRDCRSAHPYSGRAGRAGGGVYCAVAA